MSTDKAEAAFEDGLADDELTVVVLVASAVALEDITDWFSSTGDALGD